MANTKVIVIPDGKICDYVDGKFRNDTPEVDLSQDFGHKKLNFFSPCLATRRDVSQAARASSSTCCGVL